MPFPKPFEVKSHRDDWESPNDLSNVFGNKKYLMRTIASGRYLLTYLFSLIFSRDGREVRD